MIEDEIHFICDCPLYDNIRRELFRFANLINVQFMEMTSKDKYIYLKTHNVKEIILLH